MLGANEFRTIRYLLGASKNAEKFGTRAHLSFIRRKMKINSEYSYKVYIS